MGKNSKKIYPVQRRKNNKLTFRTDSHVHMGKYRQTHDNQEQDHLSWGSGGKWGITLRFNCWTAQVLTQGPTGELRYWAHPPMSNGNATRQVEISPGIKNLFGSFWV